MKIGNSIQPVWGIAISACLLVHSAHANEEQLEKIKSEVAALEEKLAEAGNTGVSVSDIEANIAAAEKEIADTKESFVERESEIAEKEFLLSIYQSAFRVVTSLERGASLGDVVMPDGSTLQNVVFVGVANGAVRLQSSAGLKTLSASELPASLAGSFQLPPTIPALTSTIESLYANKPEVAMTDADKEVGSPMAKFAGNAAQDPAENPSSDSGDSSKTSVASNEVAETTDADQGYVEIKSRNDARLKKVEALRAEYNVLYAQVKKLKAERYQQQAAFNSASIKKSKANQDRVFGAIDSKIAAVNEKLVQLKNEMTRVRAEFE